MKRIVTALLTFSCSAIVLSSVSHAQSFKVGMTSKTLFYLPFYVGQKRGFYTQENVKVELVLIGRTDVQLQALLSGEIHFGTLNADSVIAVAEKGAILKVIAGVDNAAPYFLIGGKNLQKGRRPEGRAARRLEFARRRDLDPARISQEQRAVLSAGFYLDGDLRRHREPTDRVGNRRDRRGGVGVSLFGHRRRPRDSRAWATPWR